ncbi:hypothetical protein FQN54_003280 [Arachnomyces sp. PD_36]|nr:hypothetical protein FQN54_003280 [Arachnomyces sp. PD_36]
MLHEILLSLSGQASPLFDRSTADNSSPKEDFPLLSPPEKALLGSIAHLSDLHRRLRAHTAVISSSHPSIICRAVSTAITSEHLGRFQRKILEVEGQILGKDASYVGGYGIVPLSTIAREFAPWTRRMEWLWEVARFLLPEPATSEGSQFLGACSGAGIINYLRNESQTGYRDLEEIALSLVSAAETAWMRQLSMWLLYGNLPAFGGSDFFIQLRGTTPGNEIQGVEATDFVVRRDLLPNFVSPPTASSILFIGKSLNHIRARHNGPTNNTSQTTVSKLALDGEHIQHLGSLGSPISPSRLSGAITAIRLSLSQTTLSRLLPLPKILEILSLLHKFFLLGRGEFAVALVTFADLRIRGRHQKFAQKSKSADKALESVTVGDGEVAAVLAQTWAELYALQNEEDPVDDELDLARDLLLLTVNNKRHTRSLSQSTAAPRISFDDVLFAAPTALSLHVQPPLDLFLSSSDISTYSEIHGYLLAIRWAQIRVGDLWKHTSLRRTHPAPWGPPLSSTRGGELRLRSRRSRDKARIASMRPIWATCSASIFVLSEIGGYLQGEVVNGSWLHFRQWLDGVRPGSSGSAPSRPGTSYSSTAAAAKHADTSSLSVESTMNPPTTAHTTNHDPETLTVAHRAYLASLTDSLFLSDIPFTSTLRTLLKSIDHLIALVTRLQIVQQNLDLESDEGVVDALANYAQDERDIWDQLRQSRAEVDAGIKDLITKLRDIDESRGGEGRRLFGLGNKSNTSHQQANPTDERLSHGEKDAYIPWKPAGVDRLLMKLDFGSLSLDTGPLY